MNKVFFVLILLVQTILVKAQLTPQQQKQLQDAQAKLKQMNSDPRVQQAMQQLNKVKSDTAIANKMKQANQALKDHPEAGNVALPDLNKVKVPNLDSAVASTNNQMKRAEDNAAQLGQLKQQMLPVANLSHQAESLAKLKKAQVLAIVQTTLNNVSSKVDVLMKSKLDKIVKDSTLNVAGTGLFYLSLDLSPKEACAYLICEGIQLHPSDPFAINALGVYYRDNNDLEKSLQLFLYADALLPDSLKSPYIYANIGWASFYYGDFGTAQKYFDKALALSDSFQPALEGEANVAFAKGDIQALFKCLAKELIALTRKNSGTGMFGGDSGGSGGDGPSEPFADVVTAAAIQSVKNLDEQPDPTQDKSLDNFIDESDNSASDDGPDLTYEAESRPIFVCDPKKLPLKKGEAARYAINAQSNMRSIAESINQRMSGLTPLTVSKQIDKNTITISKSYRKWVDFIAQANRLFERRIYWHREKYLDKYKPFPAKWTIRMNDLISQYAKDLSQCPCTDCGDCVACHECLNRVSCQWLPVLYGECNSDIESSSRMWNDYYDDIFNTIQWYLDVTNPIVKKISDAGWNDYLNSARIAKIKVVVLTAYADWAAEVINIPIDPYANEPLPSCPVKMGMVSTPDPFSKKPKHIKEYPDPNCNDEDYPFGPALTITENCHTTKLTFGVKWGPIDIGLSYTTNKDFATGQAKDQIWADEKNFGQSFGLSVGKTWKCENVAELGGATLEGGLSGGGSIQLDQNGHYAGATITVEGGAGVDVGWGKLGSKASGTWKLDSDGNYDGSSYNATVSASSDPMQEVAKATMQSNYDKNGHYIGGTNSISVSDQQGFKDGKAAMKYSPGGIQANQIIQVVAGQVQASPITVSAK